MPDGIPLIFPFGGRSDVSSFHDQKPLTTREATNVRVKDPRTGRMRGAQRSGLTRLVAPTSTKIREMCSLKYALNEGVDYAQGFNMLTGGENFLGGFWTSANSLGAPTAAATTGPFGATDGWRLDDADGAAESYLQYSLSAENFRNGPSGVPLFYIFSIYIKQDTALNTAIEYRQAPSEDNVQRASFLWSSETLTLTDSGGITPGTTGAIEEISGGWWRVSITFPHVDGSTGHQIRLIPDDTSDAATGESFYFGPMLSMGLVTQAFTAGATESWTDEVSKDAVHNDVDSQGNAYFLFTPGTLIKYNPAGKRLAEFSVIPDDPEHECRALFVDPDLNCIFVGVSGGGDIEKARFWFVVTDDDGSLRAAHSTLPGFFVEEMRVVRDKLYVACNDPANTSSVVQVYEGLTSNAPPVLIATYPAPHPIHGIDVNADGEVFVASGTDFTHPVGVLAAPLPQNHIRFRGVHPKASTFRPVLSDWDPSQLDEADKRIWFWWRARDITTADTLGAADVEDGVEVITMRDRSGAQRHMTRGQAVGQSSDLGATYRLEGGIPSLEFAGINGYISGPNISLTNAAGESQKTMLPAYRGISVPASQGGIFCLFMTFRPNPDATNIGAVFYQPTAVSPGTRGHILFVNKSCTTTTTTGQSEGDVSYFAQTGGVGNVDNGSCNGGSDRMFGSTSWVDASEGTNVCLLTVLWDGGTNEAVVAPALAESRSVFRINGRPIDRALGTEMLFDSSGSLDTTEFGFYTGTGSSAATNYIGQVYEVLVLDRRTRDEAEATVGIDNLVIEHDADPDITATAQPSNEMTQIESYMLHGIGCGHLLDISGETYAHPGGLKDSATFGDDSIMGPPLLYEAGPEALAALNAPSVVKLASTGKKLWVYNYETQTEGVLIDRGGAGHAVRVLNGDVYCFGPQADELSRVQTSMDTYARKIIDDGEAFSDTTGDGAWLRQLPSTGLNLFTRNNRIDVDKFGTVYIPVPLGTAASRLGSFLEILDDEGNVLFSGTTVAQETVICAHHDPRISEYGDDVIDVARFLYVGYSEGSTDFTEARRLDIVNTTITDQAQTRTTNLYVQGQDLRSFTIGGATAEISADIFNASGPVFCVPTLNEVVFIDGSTYQVYDGPDGTVSVLESETAGDVPPNARFGVFWRSRLLLAGFPGVGAKLQGSAIGDIRNWDINPPREEFGSAFILSLNEVDEAPPDVITGLIDARDDLLIVGGSRTMTRLTGDPRAGGQFHNLSTEIGMAWGNAWTKDPRGRIYFFGTNPPGLYGVGEGGDIVPLTEGTLEDSEFQAIDFSAVRIKLLWNPRDEGIHIFQYPFGVGGSIRRAWFWEYKTHELVNRPPIWPDVFDVPAVQPTAGVVLAGLVQNERRLVIGCEDGGLRVWDSAASSDDGNPIDSNVLFPPVTKQSLPRSLALRGLKVFLGTDNEGCLVQYYGSNEADRLGREVQEFEAKAGENDTFRRRVRGNNIFVRFRNARDNEFWAFENAYLKLARAQKQRRSR